MSSVCAEIEDYLESISNVRIQGQSLTCRSFTNLFKAGLFSSFQKKYKIPTLKQDLPLILGALSISRQRMLEMVKEGTMGHEEIERAREAVERCTIVSPAMWGKSCVVSPTSNFKEAALTMKPIDERASDYFFNGIEECNYIFTLPSLEGIDVCEERLGKDQATQTEGLVFATIQTPDPDTDETPLQNQIAPILCTYANSVKRNFAEHMDPDEDPKETLTFTIDNYFTHLSKYEHEETISREELGPVVSFLLVFPSKQKNCDYEYVHAHNIYLPQLRKSDKNKSPEKKQKEQIANMLFNLVIQSMSQSNAVHSTHIVYRGQSKEEVTEAKKAAIRSGSSKRQRKVRIMSTQRLTLKPDISVFEERRKAEQAAKELGVSSKAYKTQAVRAHMHAFWRGPRGAQVLGLPQLVKGYIRDGSKARQARERQKERKEKRIFWAKMNLL